MWLRRLYAHPTTRRAGDDGLRGGLVPNSLARFVRLRDQICRTPWCDAPIRHTDHPTRDDEGGATSAENGQGLCEACNYAKQAPGWRARPSPTAGTHRRDHHADRPHLRVHPPVVVTIRETPIRLDLTWS